MESTGSGVVILLVVLFAPALSSVLKSIAFRNRAAGKAEMMRAKSNKPDVEVGKGPRAGKQGRRG
ncbi:hypothetical protein [Streptomyces griseorubiginosus]|uniref:hypothetical protein n=1 Tax=Streptomyces griseorubiginosus TaxID=67304 RepID=UPI00076DB30F|nr:hypothetical protein [Streptomyces griseorubiginosus]KUM75887.1 hypothetical protein AQI84_19480 [Streptomyces griseorubiginosus]